MALDPRTPVLAGAGQVLEPPGPADALLDRPEPVDLMADALRAAADDCGGSGAGARLVQSAQSMRVLLPLSWSYVDPAALVAQRLGIEPHEHVLTSVGGNMPQTVASATALDIAAGNLDVALVTGAECIYTRVAARRHPDRPVLTWTTQPADTPPPIAFGSDRAPVTDVEMANGLDRPRNVFPLFENARRAAYGEAVAEHQSHLGALYARFSEVAATNPMAWSRQSRTADELVTVDESNRMIAFPYPKYLNANDRVDMGAAFIMCSLEAAQRAGVPDDRLVFPLSGADAHDHWFLTHRADLYRSPAMAAAATAAFDATGIGPDDVAVMDLYSCFPCAVQMAGEAIGVDLMDPGRPPTVTGGLAFAGGPGNNYVSHALATMAQRLRERPGDVGLVTGLGWYATKHSVGLWSSSPGRSPFRHVDVQSVVDALPQTAPAPDDEGPATVESYTVVHDRAGEPHRGIVAVLDGEGRRAWGTVSDMDTLRALEAEEGCGRPALRRADGKVEIR